MRNGTQTPPKPNKQQQPTPDPEASRLKRAERDSVLLWALVFLVAVAGLAFMVVGVAGGLQLVLAVLTGVTGKGIVSSMCARAQEQG